MIPQTRDPRGHVQSLPIPWDNLPLGQVTDRWLADLLGVTPECVARARKRRGIPALRPAPPPPPPPRPSALPRYVLKAFRAAHRPLAHREVWAAVLADWGQVTGRHIQRVIAALVAEGKLRRLGEDRNIVYELASVGKSSQE